MPTLRFLIAVLFTIACQSHTAARAEESLPRRYPQDAIKCYSSASPNEKIICPEGNNLCVKEVMVNVTRLSCGSMSEEYPLDVWDRKDAKCVYRKCGASCPAEPTSVVSRQGGEVLEFERVSFCCEGNLCNSAMKHGSSLMVTSPASIVIFFTVGIWTMLF